MIILAESLASRILSIAKPNSQKERLSPMIIIEVNYKKYPLSQQLPFLLLIRVQDSTKALRKTFSLNKLLTIKIVSLNFQEKEVLYLEDK